MEGGIYARIERRVLTLVLVVIATASYAKDDLTKPIRVSPDGHFLMQPDGEPFFWLSDFAQELATRLTREDADRYFQDRARKGYTVIMFGAPAYFGKSRSSKSNTRVDLANETQNAYGERLLLDEDFSRPNPKYFEHVDWLVDRAAHYHLRVAIVPVWDLFSVPTGRLTSDRARIYGKWLGRRYRDKGVIWVLGGDFVPLWYRRDPNGARPRSGELVDFGAIDDALASGLIEGDGGHPFMTYHIACCSYPRTSPPRTSLYLSDREWLSMNYVQLTSFDDPVAVSKKSGFENLWTKGYEYEPIAAEYRSTPTRPVLGADPSGEDFGDVFIPEPDPQSVNSSTGPTQLRFTAYEPVFSGAAGCGYFHVSIMAFNDTSRESPLYGAHESWQKALDSPTSIQVPYVRSLMLSRPYFTRIPDQSLIVGNAGEGSSHIAATRDRTGAYAMLYLPQGGSVTVAMAKMSGSTAVAWWFDPRTGKAARIEGVFATNTERTFTAPTKGIGEDWVLVMDDASRQFPAPGQQR